MKNNKTITSTILLHFVALFLFGQSGVAYQEKMLSQKQLSADYQILYASLTNYHPAPFQYTSEEALRHFYATQLQSFPEAQSEREFLGQVMQLIARIKCGHTSASKAELWTTSLQEQNLVLPFTIKLMDDKVYIHNTIDKPFDFKMRDEILRINGVSIQAILQKMAEMQQRDGLTYSFVNKAIERAFRVNYFLLYGQQKEFLLDYKDQDGNVKSSTVLPVSQAKDKLKEIKPAALPATFKNIYENKWSTFAVDTVSNMAYLQIKSFSDRKQFKKYYKNVFTYLAEHNNPDLIIDMRNNGGGYFGNGNKLLTYLTPEKFDFYFQRPKKKITKNKHTRLNFINKLTKVAFSIKPDKNKVKGFRSTTFSYKPSKLLYMGKVSVINNGFTFSQASLTAAQLHQHGASFYGAETGGTESGTHANLFANLTLPHSGFKVLIPYYTVISNSTKGEFGFGVKADYPSVQGFDDAVDDVLLNVLEHLKGNRHSHSK